MMVRINPLLTIDLSAVSRRTDHLSSTRDGHRDNASFDNTRHCCGGCCCWIHADDVQRWLWRHHFPSASLESRHLIIAIVEVIDGNVTMRPHCTHTANVIDCTAVPAAYCIKCIVLLPCEHFHISIEVCDVFCKWDSKCISLEYQEKMELIRMKIFLYIV